MSLGMYCSSSFMTLGLALVQNLSQPLQLLWQIMVSHLNLQHLWKPQVAPTHFLEVVHLVTIIGCVPVCKALPWLSCHLTNPAAQGVSLLLGVSSFAIY